MKTDSIWSLVMHTLCYAVYILHLSSVVYMTFLTRTLPTLLLCKRYAVQCLSYMCIQCYMFIKSSVHLPEGVC
jgi:hypothetical protein